MSSPLYDPAPRRPLARDEKWIAALFFVVFFGSLAGELLRDFTPMKLGLVFVVAAWVPLLVLHELGHALMARLLGWQVYEVVIGQGRDVARFVLGDAVIRWKLVPLTGHVRTVPSDLRYARFKQAMVFAAGPGIELLLVLIAYLVAGDRLLQRTSSVPWVLLQSVCLTAAIGGVLNLVPFAVKGGVSDGMGLLLSFVTPRKQLEWQLAAPWAIRAERLLDDERSEKALEVTDQGLERLPLHPRLRLSRVLCRAALGDDQAAVEQLDEFGELEAYDTDLKALIFTTGAEVALLAGTRERLFDARRLADLALGLRANAADALRIKGAALIELEHVESGIEQLELASRVVSDEAELERVFAWLAVGYSRLGIAQRARVYLHELAMRRPAARIRRLLADVDPRFASSAEPGTHSRTPSSEDLDA
ncbi:MAG: M50 family metallopeptidase [Polyangiaceae bacterium]|nr:M50 family metallopeptidase [Myxococcales bacterium]MCB9585533.1 M50 family metallopeptidase [Polyangiaceae bacterium]MCB9606451.1 M50 family metallopeptidase [Polyangiaceae bacterium]